MLKSESKRKDLAASILSAAFCIILLISCASTPSDTIPQIKEGKFFQTELSNGLPIVIKESRNDSERFSFAFIFDGGASVQSSNNSGIDLLLFSLLSQKFLPKSESEIKIITETTADYSVFGFSCPKKEFDSLVLTFIDCFLQAEITEDNFSAIIETEKTNISDYRILPQKFIQKVQIEIYKDSPYENSGSLTDESINQITLLEVQQNLELLKNTNRMRIASVGDFSESSAAKLILALERKLSKIESKDFTLPEISAAQLQKNKELNISKFDLISQTDLLAQPLPDEFNNRSLVLACFSCPNYIDEDYLPFALASLVYENILRHTLVMQENMTFSTGCAILPSKASLGCVSIYGVTDTKKTLSLIQDAWQKIPTQSDLNRVLSQYKSFYINNLVRALDFSEQELNSLITSWMYLNGPQEYTKRPAMVNAVSTEQVLQAFDRHIKSSPTLFSVLE